MTEQALISSLLLQLLSVTSTFSLPIHMEPVFLLNPAADFNNVPLEMLYEYHSELRRLMQVIDYQILLHNSGVYLSSNDSFISILPNALDSNIREKRSADDDANSRLPISASLPNRNSSFYTNRLLATMAKRENNSHLGDNESRNGTEMIEEKLSLSSTSLRPSTVTSTNTQMSSTGSGSVAAVTVETTEEDTSKSRAHNPQLLHDPFSPIRRFSSSSRRFSPLRNYSADDCQRLSQAELVSALKQHGTYNPDYMAWDVPGVIRFLDRTVFHQYEKNREERRDTSAVVEKNLNALERILRELDVHCDVRSPDVIAKLYNLTSTGHQQMPPNAPDRIPSGHNVVHSPTIRRPSSSQQPDHGQSEANTSLNVAEDDDNNDDYDDYDDLEENEEIDENEEETDEEGEEISEKRKKRNARRMGSTQWDQFLSELSSGRGAVGAGFGQSTRKDDVLFDDGQYPHKRQPIIGQVHIVPFGCDKRGTKEDGYLRLCGACQAIRRLPDDFFPPFINEVMCDEDKACLYFYDYPHGKCKQKHMNFVVLRNVGTPDCQIWRKFNLNVRVSCECFVDEMSFFAKYV